MNGKRYNPRTSCQFQMKNVTSPISALPEKIGADFLVARVRDPGRLQQDQARQAQIVLREWLRGSINAFLCRERREDDRRNYSIEVSGKSRKSTDAVIAQRLRASILSAISAAAI